MFIREKQIKGKTYYYLVKSVRTGKNVKQINVAYIGRNIDPKKIEKLKGGGKIPKDFKFPENVPVLNSIIKIKKKGGGKK